jgi:hypothetical protein
MTLIYMWTRVARPSQLSFENCAFLNILHGQWPTSNDGFWLACCLFEAGSPGRALGRTLVQKVKTGGGSKGKEG